MVSKQNGNHRSVVNLRNVVKPDHSHLNSVAKVVAGPTVLQYGLAHMAPALTTNSFIGVAAAIIGVALVGSLILEEASHFGL